MTIVKSVQKELQSYLQDLVSDNKTCYDHLEQDEINRLCSYLIRCEKSYDMADFLNDIDEFVSYAIPYLESSNKSTDGDRLLDGLSRMTGEYYKKTINSYLEEESIDQEIERNDPFREEYFKDQWRLTHERL